MALVKYLRTEDLAEPHKSYAENFEKTHGRLPWLRLMAGHFPPYLDSLNGMYPRFMAEGHLDRETKELMFIAASEARGCRYCVGTHSRQMVQMMGFTRDQVIRARAGSAAAELPEEQHALITFARKAAEDPKRILDSDIEELRGLGMNDQQIVEAVAIVAFSAFANAFADTLNLADDFEAMGIADEVF